MSSRNPSDSTVHSARGSASAALGLSHEALAKKVGVVHQQIKQNGAGRTCVSGSRLARLAETLEVATSYLFEQSDREAEAVMAELLKPQGAEAFVRA